MNWSNPQADHLVEFFDQFISTLSPQAIASRLKRITCSNIDSGAGIRALVSARPALP